MARRHTTFPLTGPINLMARSATARSPSPPRDDLAEATVRPDARATAAATSLEQLAVEMRGPTLAVVAPRQGGLADLLGGWRRDRDGIDVEIVVPDRHGDEAHHRQRRHHRQGPRAAAPTSPPASATIEVDTVDGDLRLRYGSATSQRRRRSPVRPTVRSGSGDATSARSAAMLQAGFGSGDLEVEHRARRRPVARRLGRCAHRRRPRRRRLSLPGRAG